MPATAIGRIPHQLTDLIQRYSPLCQLASEGVAEIKAGPGQTGVTVGGAEVGGEVVGVPAVALRTGGIPAVVGGRRGVAVHVVAQVGADRDGPVAPGLGLPGLAVDGLGSDVDEGGPATGQGRVFEGEPE